ncbi:hypothetical protein ACLMJK_001954 [Lecanora helva]
MHNFNAGHSLNNNWETFFPSFEESRSLYGQYFLSVDPLVHVVHRPSFDLEYSHFSFTSPHLTRNQTPFRALLLSVFFAAAVSLRASQSERLFGVRKETMVEKLKFAAETALSAANHTDFVDLQTLQALTIFLFGRCAEDIDTSHAALIEKLIHLAKLAGLHRNDEYLYLTPLEIQVRRLLWYQICSIDVHIAKNLGSQLSIRDDDFDTPLPFNINDADLNDYSATRVPRNGWTDVALTLIKFEYHLLFRQTLRQIIAVKDGTLDIKTARRLNDQHRKKIEAKYFSNSDHRPPIECYAKLASCLFAARCDVALLYRDAQVGAGLPHRNELQDAAINASLFITESAATLETAPDLGTWAWHPYFHQQYFPAIFLLMEIYRNPNLPRAERINAILDYAFGRSPGLNSREKNRDTLRLLLRKLQEDEQHQAVNYADARREPSMEAFPTTANIGFSHGESAAVPWSWQTIEDPFQMDTCSSAAHADDLMWASNDQIGSGIHQNLFESLAISQG